MVKRLRRFHIHGFRYLASVLGSLITILLLSLKGKKVGRIGREGEEKVNFEAFEACCSRLLQLAPSLPWAPLGYYELLLLVVR